VLSSPGAEKINGKQTEMKVKLSWLHWNGVVCAADSGEPPITHSINNESTPMKNKSNSIQKEFHLLFIFILLSFY